MTNEPGQSPQLKKAIKLRHAVALYVSSVLGSGILVLPGLAAQIAGPASSWRGSFWRPPVIRLPSRLHRSLHVVQSPEASTDS